MSGTLLGTTSPRIIPSGKVVGVPTPEGLRFETGVPQRKELKKSYTATAYRLGGFGWDEPVGFLGTSVYVFVPLWFPAMLSVGLLWVVWRKTRGKYDGKGFPVEVGGVGEVRRSSGLPPGAGG
jgi:hypothetical protein